MRESIPSPKQRSLAMTWRSAEPDVANWHYNRGVALQRVGQETDADAAYARAFALAPDDAAHREAVAGTHARRANEAMAELREEDALLELRAAIALVPSHPFATEWRRAALELEAASDSEAGQWSEGGDEAVTLTLRALLE